MQLFYSKEIINGKAGFDETEARHCFRVMRMKKGDLINITDGRGRIYEARIESDNPGNQILTVLDGGMEVEKFPYHLHIGIAPTKNIDRFEWFVEKAVEIGIDEISPIYTINSERRNLRIDRLEKIAISAMKQSLKAFLPIINQPVNLDSFLQKDFSGHNLLLAHYNENQSVELINQQFNISKYIILIGPEGDFHPDEIELCLQMNYKLVKMGKSRLRTETAGIVACQTICNIELLKIF